MEVISLCAPTGDWDLAQTYNFGQDGTCSLPFLKLLGLESWIKFFFKHRFSCMGHENLSLPLISPNKGNKRQMPISAHCHIWKY
jgi:hypothetical protein